MSKQVPTEVKAFIRAVLLSSPKGVKQTLFLREYEKFANSKIEWRKMGFNDLYEFLLAIPDVARLEYSMKEAQNLIFGVNKKDIYTSSHAKKAGLKGTGLQPRHPSQWNKTPSNSNKHNDTQASKRTVSMTNDAVKVTVSNSSEMNSLVPNEQGLFGVHIRDMPKLCTKEELEMIFKEYPSLRLCKIVVPNSGKGMTPCGFAKFSKEEDALRALKEKNGFNLRGSKLRVKAATEGSSKTKQTTNEIKTTVAQKSKDSPPKNNITKSPQRKNNASNNHISNSIFTESELKKIYSRYGTVQKVDIHADRKTASLRYATQLEASNTQKNMKEFTIDGCILTLSSQASLTSLTVHINDRSSTQDLSRLETTTSSSHSAALSSSKESIFSVYGTSSNHCGKTALTNSTSPNTLLNPQQNKHHHQDHLQQRQQQPQQPTQQGQQSNILAGYSSATSLPNSTSLEKNIHLILKKEEMETLFSSYGHPLEKRFQGLPDEIDLLVTEIVDACRFWAIIDYKTGNWQQLEQLEKHLQNTTIKTSTVPQMFTIGAGRFTENNVWYRCFVLDVTADHQNVKVLYTDYGNVEWIPLERFSSLDSIYLALPPQANAFHLAGLELNYSHSKEKLKEGAKYLKDLIGDRTLVARRKSPINSSQAHISEVELLKKAPPNESINDLMAATTYVTRVNTISKSPSTNFNQKSGEKLKLKISWVQSPRHIFYYPATTEFEDRLKKIETLLKKIPETAIITFPKVNDIVCFVMRDSARKRVKIHEYIPGTMSANVICIDHGNTIKVANAKKMLKVPEVMKSIPPVVTEAYLDDLKLPASLIIWPKEAMDILFRAREQVVDGILNKRQGNNYLVLYNDQGDCLNQKILETLDYPVASNVLGTAPISPTSITPAPATQDLPNPNSDVMVTNNNHALNQLASNPSNYRPNIHGKSNVSSKTFEHQSNIQSQGLPDAGFYMPPPPNISKEKPFVSQGAQGFNNLPQATQNNNYKPQVVQHGNSLPQVTQHGNSLPQVTQHGNSLPQVAQYGNGLPQGTQSRTSLAREIHGGKSLPQGSQMGNSLPQGNQSANSLPQRTQMGNSLSQRIQSANNLPQGTQSTNSLSQGTQSTNSLPQGAHVANSFPSPALVNGPPMINNESNYMSSVSKPNSAQGSQALQSMNGTLNQSGFQQESYEQERETLLAKRREQEECIARLSKAEPPKLSTQNLQELKAKLAKQVKIKELENQVLKLMKEVESLEETKANLQYKLLNN